MNKKGGKAIKLAVFADDAKESELIGESWVAIDDVLKKGEIDGAFNLTDCQSLAEPQNGTTSSTRTSTAVKCISN